MISTTLRIFNPQMLETKKYKYIKEENQIVAAAGIHVYSEEFQCCSIGNVCVHKSYYKKGLGRAVTSALISELKVKTVGLNVEKSNLAAIKLYESLGFEKYCDYYEFSNAFNRF